MKRRTFLALMSLVLMGCMRDVQEVAEQAKGVGQPKQRIAVIGAGLAGLAAARELQAHGHAVVVVEARDRIGGRIWTSSAWPDLPLDLGASWIHGLDGNPLTALAETLEAELLVTEYEKSIAYDTDGEPLSDAAEAQLDAWRDQVYAALAAAQDADEDTSLRAVVDALFAETDQSPQTRRFLNFLLSSEIETEYGGSAEDLSAYWFDNGKFFPGDDALFGAGFQVITEHLARDLQIELGQVVQEIAWGQAAMRVLTDQTEYLVDQVLVTVPLGVLQAGSVRFTPDLPAAKQQAIEKLGMGVLNKCYLHFPEAFWPADVDWLEYIPEEHGAWTEWLSLQRVAGLPILLGFNAADQGRAIEAWSDQAIVASAMGTLRTIFGDDIPDPLDYQLTRWASDPFALGSYSYDAVGVSPTTRKALAKPLQNRLFFAGEATEHNYYGTAHGAYLSGLRAAKEML